MIRVGTRSGHWLAIDMRAFTDTVSFKVEQQTEVLLSPSDVEAVLAALLRMRERQRDHLPIAVESKEPPTTQARPDVKRRKPTAK